MKENNIRAIISDALIYGYRNDGYADDVVDDLIDKLQKILERNPRFPRLTYSELDLLFADFRTEAIDLLDTYERVDWREVAETATEALIEAFEDEGEDEDEDEDETSKQDEKNV